jgi:hypothetical protein
MTQGKWRVARISNFEDPMYAESFVEDYEDGGTEEEMKKHAADLNSGAAMHGATFYKAVPFDYKLYDPTDHLL